MGDPTTHLLKSSTRYSISCATGGRAEGEERWEKVRADDTGAFSRAVIRWSTGSWRAQLNRAHRRSRRVHLLLVLGSELGNVHGLGRHFCPYFALRL